MTGTRKRLGDLLVESGLITDEQLQSALEDKPRDQKLGDLLLQRGYITEQQLIEVLEFRLGIPHVNTFQIPIRSEVVQCRAERICENGICLCH